MFLDEPVLTKNIPGCGPLQDTWGKAEDRTVTTGKTYRDRGGYTAENCLGMEPSAIIDEVKNAILRGRGGAGFPAGMKWTFLPPEDGQPRYLAINCDEAEPGTFKDRLLVDFDPHLVLEGIAIAAGPASWTMPTFSSVGNTPAKPSPCKRPSTRPTKWACLAAPAFMASVISKLTAPCTAELGPTSAVKTVFGSDRRPPRVASFEATFPRSQRSVWASHDCQQR